MALISFVDYRTLSDDLAAARESTLNIMSFTFDAVYTVVLLQDVQQEVDMLNDFWNTYLLNADTFETPSTLLGAVRSMDSHVLNRSSYTTVDSYLVANGGTVSQVFADLSASAGYPITEIDP